MCILFSQVTSFAHNILNFNGHQPSLPTFLFSLYSLSWIEHFYFFFNSINPPSQTLTKAFGILHLLLSLELKPDAWTFIILREISYNITIKTLLQLHLPTLYYFVYFFHKSIFFFTIFIREIFILKMQINYSNVNSISRWFIIIFFAYNVSLFMLLLLLLN